MYNATNIKELVRAAGAVACGITAARAVDRADRVLYDSWLARGDHAAMSYMERNMELRFDPRQLEPGCRTVIAAAFNYRQPRQSPLIAEYALGQDYHHVIRARLGAAAETLCSSLGGHARTITDSAPMRERWWAQQAGIGYSGDNGLLIVPGYGSAVLLGFILWSGEAQADSPSQRECLHCGACSSACPGKAIGSGGVIDARRCLSYLTIEHRGDLPQQMPSMTKFYGCDCCRQACPLDCGPVTEIAEFMPDPAIAALTPQTLAAMGSGEFRRTFAHSPIARIRLQGLRRNVARLVVSC